MRGLAIACATALALVLASPALADEPRARLEGVEDRRLAELIRDAIGRVREPPASRLDARRRATEAAERAILVLRSEGFYQAALEPTVSEGDPPQAILTVEPGRRFVIGSQAVVWDGAQPIPEAQTAAESASRMTLGEPGRAADVLLAEGGAISALQQQGYPDAVANPREVVVDHADFTVRPTFHIAAGDLVRLDGVVLDTQGRTRPGYVEALIPWRSGDRYSPTQLAELELRLLDVGVYRSVTVALAPADRMTPEGLRPVAVNLQERRPYTLEAGVSYSTTDGAGVDVRLLNFNRMGRFDTITYTFKAAEIQQRLDAELSLPHWRRPNQRLRIGAGFSGNRTDAYNDYGFGVRVDVERRFVRPIFGTIGSYLTVGATLDYVATYDKTVAVPDWQNLGIFTLLGAFAWDASDNALDPSRGWRVEARAEPTLIGGDVSIAYVRAQVQGAYYLPLGQSTTLATRARIGSIVGGSLPEVPASRRLYAGGGGSVRGYSYQGVGPRLVDNTPAGGLSLVETSVELRRHLFDRWGGALFVDAGSIGVEQFPTFNELSVGVGAGVRYDLGFGPIRFDIAFPLNRRDGDSAFQIYISIGQAF